MENKTIVNLNEAGQITFICGMCKKSELKDQFAQLKEALK